MLGPAGVTAGLYTKRANLNVLIIYKEPSGLEKADVIENYYGFKNGISGEILAVKKKIDTATCLRFTKLHYLQLHVIEVISSTKDDNICFEYSTVMVQ